jgi:hypothetical protein
MIKLRQRGSSWYVDVTINGQRIRRSLGSDLEAATKALEKLQKRKDKDNSWRAKRVV